ncbi:non-ribosomal peptide synthetase [Microtetraspora fusca]|uniref:non-ribosomal peptide synthetase n=1 Tax=Microtetraspora fusca TaxID=1997 RepID=UPI000830204F|nr:non-ribosomal peptide synthetase [Microtetraspora fusca]
MTANDTEALREDLIRRRLAGARRKRQGIPPADRSAPLPLSFGQRRLWLLHRLDPASPEYLVPMALRLRGPLDATAVWRAWDAMVIRHEILRTRYVVVDGEPAQVVDEPRAFPVREADLTGLPADERLPAALEVFEREARTPISLEHEWPVRAWLGRLDDEDHVMFAVYHHIAVDGWSQGVINTEWPALYLAYALGHENPLADLPPLPVQYADYASWQRSRISGPLLDRELEFWHGRLSGVPHLELPTDRPRPAVRDWSGGKVEFRVPPELAERLRRIGRERQATLFMVLLTAFQVLLSRYSGQRDIAVGTPVAGRTMPEISGMIGFTVNTLVIRGRWHDDPLFTELLDATRLTVLDALDHQELPFERLVDDLQPERDMSRNPLFQVMFGLHNEETSEGEYGTLKAETLLTSGSVAKFDLNLQFEETAAGGLFGVLDYASALFDADTVSRMADHLRRLLENIAADPERPVSALRLLAPHELPDLEAPAAPGDPEDVAGSEGCGSPGDPVSLVVDLVEERARVTPDAIALTVGGASTTYAELDERADRLAWRLRSLGVGPESLVAVCLPRGALLVPALLAVWKAGGAYVPLDPGHPPARLRQTLADCGAEVVVTDSGLADAFDGARLLLLDEPAPHAAAVGDEDGSGADRPPGPPERTADPDGLAYVIYTSGSTGRPKGVMVTHGNLARLLAATRDGFRFGPDDVWTLFHSAAFDFSVWEMWGALSTGGRLVVVPYTVSRSPEEFLDLLVAERVTVLNQTPSAFAGLAAAVSADDGRRAALRLRLVVFGGERLDAAALPSWPGVEMVNMYGITETTVHVTRHPADPAERGAGSRVGRALDGVSARVVDCYGDLAAPGAAGEIHVGGSGVARGYLGRPGLTAERFLPDPYGPPGSRRYRTGDRARLRGDGGLEFLGRVDDQIALRGYRIEPGEVEAVVTAHPAVREAAVVVRDGRLVAYVTYRTAERTAGADPAAGSADTREGGALAAELRGHCASLLPSHMVPALFVGMERLPLTPNGKTDRRALPEIDPGDPAAGSGAATPPETQAEARMLGLWTRVLGRSSIGTGEDFFELGGDSLRAVALVGDLRAAGFDVSVRDLFERRTVAGLARLADERPTAGEHTAVAPFALLGPDDLALIPADAVDAYPLSQVQAGMVYQSLAHPEARYYHDVFSFGVRDEAPFSAEALRAAVARAVERHENLRTSIDLSTFSTPMQVVHAAADPRLVVRDVRHLPAGERAEDAARWLAREWETPVELERAPLLRLFAQVEEDGHWRLGMTLHHAIVEGWSQHTLLMELLDDYRSLRDGREPPERPLPAVRYADFVAAEVAALASPDDEGYWERQLTTHARWAVPADWADATAGDEVDQVRVDLLDAYEGLARLASSAGVPLKSVLLAAHLKVLSAFTPDTAFHTGLVCDARPEAAGADRVHGMFLNIVPFPFRLDAPTWRDLVRDVFAREVDLWPHRRFPFPEMQRRWAGGAELLPIFFNYLDFHVIDTDVVDLPESTGETPNEFALQVTTLNGTLTLTARRRDVGPAAAARLAEMYRRVLTAMAEDPEGDALAAYLPADDAVEGGVEGASEAVSAVALRDGGVVGEWRSAPDLVAARAVAVPDAVAVVSGGGALSFGELDRRARGVAGRLRRLGVGPESLVGVCLERGVDLLPVLVGVWYAGAAYLPVEPSWPPARRWALLADAGARVLIAADREPHAGGAVQEAEGAPEVVVVTPEECLSWRPEDAPDSAAGAVPVASGGLADGAEAVPVAVDPDSLAYVIYTSGSTGRPKGVEITHRNLASYLRHCEGRGGAPLFSSVAFDMAVTTLFAPLVAGEPVHLLPPDLDVADLGPALAESGPYDFVKLTPSHLEALCQTVPPGGAAGLARAWLVGGEALAPSLVERWRKVAPDSVVVNEYGPTEATVACSTFAVPEGADGARAPIGRAMPGASLRVLDRWYEPRPTGVPGEIMIGGVGVARGYRGRPALTAERFVPDPYGPPGSRMYRSGDVGRVLESGDLDLLGRVDEQVKIRGYRVEPGEVAAVLAEHPGVSDAVVIAVDGRLVGYVVPAPEPPVVFEGAAPALSDVSAPPSSPGSAGAAGRRGPGEAEALAWLRERLPVYMVPWRLVEIAAVPLTANGKLDRAALPEPSGAGSAARDPLPAATPTEAAIAEVWQEVLELSPVGVEDDFFELGGHSLLTLRAVALANRRGLPVRAHDILELRTVRALARRVDGAEAARPLVWLNRRPTPPRVGAREQSAPLFVVHPAGGASHWYRPLAERLSRPVASFVVPGLDDAADVVRLAAHYVGQIRAAETPPYRLLAWSSGSTIAWEIAAQLIAAGGPAPELILVDPMADIPGSAVGAETFDLLETLLREPGRTRLARGVTAYRARKLLAELGITATRDDFEALDAQIELWRTLDQATAEYRFPPLPIPLRLVVSDDCVSGRHTVTGRRPYAEYLDRWRALAGGGLTLHRLGCDHRGVFNPPYVDLLVRIAGEVTPNEART